MLLSETMRLGAMAGPQAFGVLFGKEKDSTCAMGSVILALGGAAGESLDGIFTNFKGFVPDQRGQEIRSALYLSVPDNTWQDVVYRNNILKQSREEIANWLVESGRDVEIPTFLLSQNEPEPALVYA